MADYLALPALSASLVQKIVDECPRAAWFASWLNPAPPPGDDNAATDKGQIAHAILLEGSESMLAVIDRREHPNEKGGGFASGWTNKSIKAARDTARDAGKIPMLVEDVAEVRAMVAEANRFIDSLRNTEPSIYAAFRTAGDSELTVTWDEEGTPCKLRADRISADRRLIINYKTSGMSVEPDRWGRTQFLDYYVGAAWYRRGIRALSGVDAEHVYLCQETAPPHLCSLVGVDPSAFELGDQKCAVGLALWKKCAATGVWPGYPNRVAYPELAVWERARWEAKEILSIEERLLLGSQA
jgi:hypothetical protein